MRRNLGFICLLASAAFGQATPDESFDFVIEEPFLEKPLVVAIDEGHNNRHTRETGYTHLSQILE